MKLQGMALGRLAGHLGFLILIALSIVLAPERVLFVDSAAQLFEMIQHGSFAIYDHRYTMAITQLLPLLGIKLGLPLPLLVVLYSVAAPLLGYLAFLLLAYRVKDIPLALFLLLPMLCIRHTFFHAISESFSLMIYATLLLALLRHPAHSWLYLLGVVVATLACVFMHPIGMFFVLFLLGYHLVDNRLHPTVALWVGVATLMIAVVVRSTMISGHDASFLPTWGDVCYAFAHPLQLSVLRGLVGRWYLYMIPLLCYCWATYCQLRQRQWLQLGYYLLFNICFIVMSVVVYRNEGGNIAIERAWLPIAFFAGVPAVVGMRRAASADESAVFCGRFTPLPCIIGIILFAVAMTDIVHTSRDYRARLEGLQEIVERGRREGHRKLVAPQQEYQWPVQSWAVAFETMIISSLDGPDGTVTLYLEEEEPFDESNPDYSVTDAYLAVPWNRLWHYSTLNSRYFRLPEQGTEVIKESL